MIHAHQWFVVLNVVTSGFGLIYFFAQAMAACKDCSKIHKWLIMVSFASSGVTLFLSLCLLNGWFKYESAFLLFSWLTVGLSAYFLQRPKLAPVPEKPKPEEQKEQEKVRVGGILMHKGG